MLLPGSLTYEGMPHSLRVIGTIPACYLLAAYGGDISYGWLGKKLTKNPEGSGRTVDFYLRALSALPLFCPMGPKPRNARRVYGRLGINGGIFEKLSGRLRQIRGYVWRRPADAIG